MRADKRTSPVSVINMIDEALTSANAFAPTARPSSLRLSRVTVATIASPPITASSISSLTAPARTARTLPANWFRALVFIAMLSINA